MYLVVVIILNFIFTNSVYWEPEIPVPGGDITIYYNTFDGDLPNNTFPVYVHLGYDGWVDVDDYAMSYAPSTGTGWWKYTYQIPEDAETVDFVSGFARQYSVGICAKSSMAPVHASLRSI